MTARAASWKAADPEKTSDEIKGALSISWQNVIYKEGFDYESDDFKTGVNEDGLEQWAASLFSPLVSLDTRGGFLAQLDCEGAVKQLAEEDAHKGPMASLAAKKGIPMKKLISSLCYKLRVMLAHVRIKQKQWAKHKDASSTTPGLRAVFELFMASPVKARPRRDNPFIRFQSYDDDADQDQMIDDEPATAISMQLVLGDRVAYAKVLMSDGRSVHAERYSVDSKGFLVAHFPNTEETFETEIMEKHLEPDGKFILRPAVPSTCLGKRPRADAEGDDSVGEEEIPIRGRGKGRGKGKRGRGKAKAKGKAKARGQARSIKPARKTPVAKGGAAKGEGPLGSIMKELPEDARSPKDIGTRKSYTLSVEGQTSRISVILNTYSLYVSPVHALPAGSKQKIDRKHGVSLTFRTAPSETWELAKRIAGWP